MKSIWLAAAAAGLAVGSLVKSVLGPMVEEEARTRLTRIPAALVRVALMRVPPDIRDDLASEWNLELDHIVNRTDGLPATRLLEGTRYAAGLVWAAWDIASELEPCTSRKPLPPVRVHAVIGSSIIVLTGAAFIMGIYVMISQGVSAREFAFFCCMAACYVAFGMGLARASVRMTAATSGLGLASQLTAYLVTGNEMRLEAVGLYVVPVVVIIASAIKQRITKRLGRKAVP